MNTDLSEINLELKKFDEDLSKKKQYIIFNKIDLLSSEDLNIIKNEVYKSYEKKDVFFTSTVNNKGIEELKKYIYNELEKLNTN